jgi:hypothetical protein
MNKDKIYENNLLRVLEFSYGKELAKKIYFNIPLRERLYLDCEPSSICPKFAYHVLNKALLRIDIENEKEYVRRLLAHEIKK